MAAGQVSYGSATWVDAVAQNPSRTSMVASRGPVAGGAYSSVTR